jgi:hypothetical protein
MILSELLIIKELGYSFSKNKDLPDELHEKSMQFQAACFLSFQKRYTKRK